VTQHITRKELKQDKFAETLAHGAEELASHQRQLWYLGAAALVVILAVIGWRLWSERVNAQAQTALDEAMRVFNARIRAAGEPEEPGQPSYVDEKNKLTDAAQSFEKVSAHYARTRPGRLARYYAGLCYAQLGNNDEAQKWLRMVEGSSDAELAPLARLQLAQVLARMGKGDDAVKLYQQLIAKPSTFVPKAVAILALAEHYEKTNPAEATKLYTQLQTEFPNTSIATQAEERLAEMKPKS
jgi:predicted negative regulator of RcsB-dependent stress response